MQIAAKPDASRLSSRLMAVQPSPTIAMTRLAAEMRRDSERDLGRALADQTVEVWF